MTARYAVFDTLADRDIKEFDDLSAAYTEIDRLTQRNATRVYAVRPAQERRERVRPAKVGDLLPTPEPVPVNRPTADAVQFDGHIGWGAAFQILEAIKHLATAIEQLGRDFSEIKLALRQPEAERSSQAGCAPPSAAAAKQPAPYATAAIDAAVRAGASVVAGDAPMSKGSRTALLAELHELRQTMSPDGSRLNPDGAVAMLQGPAATPLDEPEQLPDLTTADRIKSAYQSQKITREQAFRALEDLFGAGPG